MQSKGGYLRFNLAQFLVVNFRDYYLFLFGKNTKRFKIRCLLTTAAAVRGQPAKIKQYSQCTLRAKLNRSPLGVCPDGRVI